MSQEIKNAAVNEPRSMVFSIVLNGCMGFGMLLATLFSLDDIDKVTSTPPTQYPFMSVFVEAIGSLAGSSTMAAIVAILGICAAFAITAASSRMYWSFARDRSIPLWRTFSKVSSIGNIFQVVGLTSSP